MTFRYIWCLTKTANQINLKRQLKIFVLVINISDYTNHKRLPDIMINGMFVSWSEKKLMNVCYNISQWHQCKRWEKKTNILILLYFYSPLFSFKTDKICVNYVNVEDVIYITTTHERIRWLVVDVVTITALQRLSLASQISLSVTEDGSTTLTLVCVRGLVVYVVTITALERPSPASQISPSMTEDVTTT